jgi:uncharacterized protein YoxC
MSAKVKYALLALALVLWSVGLGDQLHSVDTTAKYVAISLVMVAIATIL